MLLCLVTLICLAFPFTSSLNLTQTPARLDEGNSTGNTSIPACGKGYDKKSFPPWHVDLYLNGSLLPACGGTIIGRHYVLTAARCVYDEKVNGIINSEKITVVSGKYKPGNETGPNEQRIEVERIALQTSYRGQANNYQYDIALLILSRNIVYTSSIIPICLDWASSMKIDNGGLGTITCWKSGNESDFSHNGLKTIKLPYINRNSCRYQAPESFRIFITDDKFCTGVENNITDVPIDEKFETGCLGSGLTFSKNDRWYLLGILSVRAVDGPFLSFTTLDDYHNWIKKGAVIFQNKEPPTTTRRPTTTTTTPRIDVSCKYPQKEEGTNYVVEGSGSLVALAFYCDPGYALPSLIPNTNYSIISLCREGSWTPKEVKCQKMCEALFSESLDLKCTFRGDIVDCSHPAVPGTKVWPKCKMSYQELKSNTVFRQTECTSDGTWRLPLFECVPECGKARHNSEKLLIANGNATIIGEYPWHAGLYSTTDLKEPRKFDYKCGGTIITTRLVITAAHCVEPKRVISNRHLSVVVGKYYRAWNVKEPAEQRMGVKKIILPEAYSGERYSYALDIAVLKLSCSIILSDVVLPVCIDWSSRRTLVNGMLGTVVGWGEDENGFGNEELKVAQLPFMDYRTCNRTAPTEFLKYITYDKFCARSVNGTSVQRGDSGGGFTFEMNNNLHFLFGIVSIKPRNSNSFAAYTDIRIHMEWLDDVKEKHQRGTLRPCVIGQ